MASKQSDESLNNSYQRQLRKSERALALKAAALELKTIELAKKEVELELAKQELRQLKKISWIQYGFNLAGAIICGFGINLATSNPGNLASWVMIAFALVIETMSFLMISPIGEQKRNP